MSTLSNSQDIVCFAVVVEQDVAYVSKFKADSENVIAALRSSPQCIEIPKELEDFVKAGWTYDGSFHAPLEESATPSSSNWKPPSGFTSFAIVVEQDVAYIERFPSIAQNAIVALRSSPQFVEIPIHMQNDIGFGWKYDGINWYLEE